MKRIVVSGASGFLGSHIVEKALQMHIDVVAITSRSERMSRVASISTKAFLQEGYPFTKDDVFINCLFPTNADGFKLAQGLDTVYSMLSMARKSSVGAMINISSQSVYASKREDAAKETDALCLETPYAVGKYSSEVFCNQLFSDTPHTSVRMASLLGVGFDQRILNRMSARALRGEPLNVIGGMQRYGFLDVRDAAAGLLCLAQSDSSTWKPCYNLGRMDNCTLLELANCIADEVKKQTGNTICVNVSEGQDYRNSSLDVSRFLEEFDWQPEITLAQTTVDIIHSQRVQMENQRL